MQFRGMDGNELFARTIAEQYRNLRSLDLSGSSLTGECAPPRSPMVALGNSPRRALPLIEETTTSSPTLTIADDDVYTILDGCPMISHIDLTSCRGVSVRNRRNIFKVSDS